jgi:hypothetical protein
MSQAKTSKKNYIFLSHPKTIYDEKELEQRTFAYAQGSISGSIEANFAVVAYAHKYVEDGEVKYGMLVKPTKEILNTSVKTPFGMFDEPLIKDNDVNILFEAIDNY